MISGAGERPPERHTSGTREVFFGGRGLGLSLESCRLKLNSRRQRSEGGECSVGRKHGYSVPPVIPGRM